MQKWRQWEAASEAAWGLALEREAVIRPLAEQGKVSMGDVEEATRQLQMSRSLLYALVSRCTESPDLNAFVFNWFPGFSYNAIVLKARTSVLKARTKFR